MTAASKLGITGGSRSKSVGASKLGLKTKTQEEVLGGEAKLQGMDQTEPRSQFMVQQEQMQRKRNEDRARLMNTLSQTVGGNFTQKPLDDFGLVYDMKRSDDFSEKRRKFMDTYPQGKLIPVKTQDGSINLIGQKSEDQPFQIVENIPAEAVQAMTSGRTIGGTLGAIGGGMMAPPGMIGMGIAALGTFGGSLAGQQAEFAIERYRGYEDDSFSGALSEDVGGALFDSAIDVATMGAGKLLRAGKRIGPREVNLGEEIKKTAEATQRQGLQPLTRGQTTESPLVRGIFFQAAGTSGQPSRTLTAQKAGLRGRLEDLSKSDYKSLSDENLGNILREQTKQLDMIARNPRTAPDEAMETLQEGIKAYEKASKEGVDRLYEQAKTLGRDVSFDVSTPKQIADEVAQGILTKTEAGQVTEAGRPLKGDLKRIVNKIRGLSPTITTFKAGDTEQSAFEQIKAVRNDLFDLKSNPNAPGSVRSAAKRLYGSLTESMYNPIGGDKGAREAFMKANRANAVREANLEKQKIKQLIRSEDPATLAKQFISPNRIGTIETIRNLAGDEYFGEVQDFFKTEMMRDPKKGLRMFEEYSNNPRVMDTLLPNKNERKLIRKRLEQEQKLMNSPIQRHFDKMENEAERAFRVAKEGSAKEMKELLEAAGGGVNGDMAKDMRAGIYAKILNDATTTTQTGQKVVDPTVVRNYIEDLETKEPYKVLFGTDQLKQQLDDLRRASAAMGGDIDVGGSMQAGEARGALTSGEPGRMVRALRTIGSNELFGYLLSRPRDFRKIPTGKKINMDYLRATTQLMSQLNQQYKGDEVAPEYIKTPSEKAEVAYGNR